MNRRRKPPTPAAETGRHAVLRQRPAKKKESHGRGSPPPAGPSTLRRIARVGLKLGIAGAAAWALLVGAREGYDYATTSPRFEVRALMYEPTEHVDDETLRGLMALPPGTNILSVDLEDVAERIVAHPWVAHASVVRVLPDGLEVEVTEYRAEAVLLASAPMLMDATGHAFKVLEDGERGELPIVTGVSELSLMAGAAPSKRKIERAMRAMDAWSAKRRPRLGEIHVGDAGELTLYTAEVGTQLLMGRGDIDEALARYDALRAALGDDAEALAVVHLDHTRGPDRPDRVVATFLPTPEPPELLVEAEAAADAKAEQIAEDQAKAEERAKRRDRKKRGERQSKRQSRLPKYD